VNFKTAYAANKEVSLGDRGGLGAATFKADGRLLVPVVVEKAGEVTFAARFTLAAGAKRTLQFTATDNLEEVRTRSTVIDLALAGSGKIAQSTDFTLSFPKDTTDLSELKRAIRTESADRSGCQQTPTISRITAGSIGSESATDLLSNADGFVAGPPAASSAAASSRARSVSPREPIARARKTWHSTASDAA
jgi:hypothetical protein